MTSAGHMLLLLLLPAAAAQMSAVEPSRPPFDPGTSGSYSGCGPLSPLLLAGLVAADAVMSLIIVGVVFVCARPQPCPRPTREDGKIYINMPGRG